MSRRHFCVQFECELVCYIAACSLVFVCSSMRTLLTDIESV
jgi:hypothetical protein